MNETKLHTLNTLARRFKRYGITRQWLQAEAEAERIPCFKAGRRLLFDSDAVEAALLQRAARRSEGGVNVSE